MIRMFLAAAAAIALTTSAPAYAGGCKDCKDCPQHKVAASDSAEKKDTKVACPCGKGDECKCGPKCECPHCHAAKEKKDEKKT